MKRNEATYTVLKIHLCLKEIQLFGFSFNSDDASQENIPEGNFAFTLRAFYKENIYRRKVFVSLQTLGNIKELKRFLVRECMDVVEVMGSGK